MSALGLLALTTNLLTIITNGAYQWPLTTYYIPPRHIIRNNTHDHFE
ncbi:hypothetical protein [Paraflavitalea speifideaquila]|nr:hypothetical protein [Paraflavitalea speifideiaquila]